MRWKLKPIPDKKIITQLSEDLSINKNLAKILIQRGIKTFDDAKQFFRPSLGDLHDPYLLKDMDLAVQRIEKAIINNENILIYGDYDVDGTTAVSLVYLYLTSFYPNVKTYVPDRYDEGYGVSYKGIDFAYDNNFSLIIALDCGIKAIEKVEYATTKNIDFIICDHHKPGDKIPNAIAVLNAKRKDCNYPYDELCGCGVGFKLIQALAKNRQQGIEDLVGYLDLVATAIAADIVPITGENRILTYFGLKMINSNPRNGIKAIMKQQQKEKLNITDIVFIIAPRINAAGRMKHGSIAVSLLTEKNMEKANKKAVEIEKLNEKRKEFDEKITKEALKIIKEKNETQKYTTVVYNENWHKGVIGIVASRLIETYYRPTVVFTKSGDKLAASVRSIKGFDVYKALEQCSEYIEQFGGHKYAAGLTILPEKYNSFKTKFEEVVSQTVDKEMLTPEITIDTVLNLNDIDGKFFRIIKQMAPFGPKNMKPVFVSNEVKDNGYGKKVGENKKHLKLNVFQKNKEKLYGAIGFGLGDKEEKTKNLFDIVYSLDENNWNGKSSIQLVLRDIK